MRELRVLLTTVQRWRDNLAENVAHYETHEYSDVVIARADGQLNMADAVLREITELAGRGVEV